MIILQYLSQLEIKHIKNIEIYKIKYKEDIKIQYKKQQNKKEKIILNLPPMHMLHFNLLMRDNLFVI